MGIIIDIIIIAIIAISTFLAYKKGLIALAIKLCAFIIAIVVTFILYNPVSNLVINVTNIDETVQNAILEKTTDLINQEEIANQNETMQNLINQAKEGTLPEASRELAISIVKFGVMIILFLAVRIGLVFVTALANMLAGLPIIKQLNKSGGIVYGLLRGIILVYAIFMIMVIVQKVNPTMNIEENIKETFIAKYMYEHNVLNIFIYFYKNLIYSKIIDKL